SERQALARLRQGDPELYLTQAAQRGRLHLDDDPIAAKQRLLEDWWQTARHDLSGTVMLAHRRSDVRELNEAARTLLTRAGHLSGEALTLGEREFLLGDRVICRRNDGRMRIRNGTRATITAIGDDALALRTDGGMVRTIDLGYAAEHLEHGYA